MKRWMWLVALFLLANAGSAQQLRQAVQGLLGQQSTAAVYVGQPYGVGKWTVPLPGVQTALVDNSDFSLTEKNGRVRYSVFKAEPVKAVIREFIQQPPKLTVYFLFVGTGPLELTLATPGATVTTLVPQQNPAAGGALLSEWWTEYVRQTRRLLRPPDYPQVVDTYLLGTLSRRLNLPPATQVPPSPIRARVDALVSQMTGSLDLPIKLGTNQSQADDHGLIPDTDALRRMYQTQVLSPEPPELANMDLPKSQWPEPEVPQPKEGVEIEPIASHVPPEFAYIRFGSFENYLWFRDTMDRWSGDLKNLLNRRGVDYRVSERTERQISLKEGALSRTLGPSVVEDVAMLLGDFDLREGGTIGFLFQAKNNFLLSTDFKNQRAATVERERGNDQGCSDEEVEISGRMVSVIGIDNQRVRSFYATDGDYHLVTNSRHLVERFFEVIDQNKALDQAKEFRYIRQRLPLNREDTVFIHLPTAFFNALASPKYQIELHRRLKATAAIDMAVVAQTAARAERAPAESIGQLVQASYLPNRFGQQPDRSSVAILNGKGEFVDTERGARGSMIPAWDRPPKSATASERVDYEYFRQWFATQSLTGDAITLGLKRSETRLKRDDSEHVVLDALVGPMNARRAELWHAKIATGKPEQVAAVPADALAFDVLRPGGSGPVHLYGALRNAPPSQLLVQPPPNPLVKQPIPTPVTLPQFYLGSYPTADALAMLKIGQVNVDGQGYGKTPQGLHVRAANSFTTVSMQQPVLAEVTPQLRVVGVQQPQTGWLVVQDLALTQLADWFNGRFYHAARVAAIGNLRFLHELTAQLGVPQSEAVAVAERMVDGSYVDPLGGDYQLVQVAGAPVGWGTTSMPAGPQRLADSMFSQAPASYKAPILSWLHLLHATFNLQERELVGHVELEMPKLPAKKPVEPKKTDK